MKEEILQLIPQKYKKKIMTDYYEQIHQQTG